MFAVKRLVLSSTLKQEFQKDLELFKHFLLLINNSGPIRNVELMWNEELDPLKPKFKNRVGTEDALVQLQPGGSSVNRSSPSTMFCDLVHGFGAHEEATCAHSDVPAQKRCQQSGCSQVYSCHVGLIDIAVPVVCDHQYLGTLFSGQVLTHAPSAEGFEQVRKTLAGQRHIDFSSLESAYFRVPVVDDAQVAEMVRVLELFARYIGNSWKRLQIMGEFQKTHDRELALDRKELAMTLLSGELGDRNELTALARRAGLQRLPDRVLVLHIKNSDALPASPGQTSAPVTLNRLSHIMEDFCQSWANTLALVVRPGELCIFTGQEARNRGHENISLQEMTEAILAAVSSHPGASGRIGVSAAHSQPAELVQGYQQACAALNATDSAISFFKLSAAGASRPVEALERLVKAIQQGANGLAALPEFLAHAMPSEQSASGLQQSRALLTWAIEHLALEVISVGADNLDITAAKKQALSGVVHASSPFSACEAFRRFADLVATQVASTFSQREHKVVLAVTRLIEKHGVAKVTIQFLADEIHLSSGHLSRVFRRNTGMTLEVFLIRQRVDLAKRTLLDPRLNIAEVAERCGFCNPAYFASVFKKYVNCTPREFARQPQFWTPLSSASLWTQPGSTS